MAGLGEMTLGLDRAVITHGTLVRDPSKRHGPPYGTRQRWSLPVAAGALLEASQSQPNPLQELTMADLAFVVTTIAVFALVALVAKGVTKL
ncbi:hypothetical protein [Streptomyces sp. E2N166]|uniref:hypothetical protein n=1 Tax=Streptomyces sp. E2N166 TaxID=1851909 RepID=UPI000EF6F5D5|nr:hypothetical protein [Streptomyces sp. E2N166]